MPNDNDAKPDIDREKRFNLDNGAELSHANLEPIPSSSPVPSVEQEPQTSTLTSQPNASLSSSSNQPQDSANSVLFAPQPQVPGNSNKSKKKWLIGGIIAGVVVLLVASGVTAYFVYQNPDKVVADGLVNIFNSQPRSVKASMSAENDTIGMDVNLDLKGNDKAAAGTLTAKVAMKEQKLNFEGSVDVAATSDGDGYLKLKDADVLANKVVDAILDAQVEQYKAYGMTITNSQIAAQKKEALAQINPIVEKINNRWIKFSTNKTDSDVSEEQKCLTDAMKKLQNEKATRDEFAKAYTDNKFINVKEQLGVKDGSYGFVLDLDKEKAKSFGKAAQETSFFKEIEKCQGGSSASSLPTDSSSSNSDVSGMRVELWVSQWSHQITQFKLEGTDTSSTSNGDTKVKFDINLGYENTSDVTVPTNAVDFEDLQKEFENLTPATTTSATSSMSI